MSLTSQHFGDAMRGDSKLPELASVALTDADLDAGAIVRSLAFEGGVRVGLIELALASGPPAPEKIDAALEGAKTAAAKARLAQHREDQAKALAALEAEKGKLKASVADLGRSIAALEGAHPPQSPAAPNFDALPAGPDRDGAERRHAESLMAYKAALAQHNARQAELPELRSQAKSAAIELSEVEAAIGRHEAETLAGARELEGDIAEARDRDLVAELDRLLGKASEALSVQARPVQGFWTLLAAGSLLDFIEKATVNPSFAARTRQRFMSEAAALGPLVERELGAIAGGCLAGPTAVARALAANRATVASLSGRLAALAPPDLDEGVRRARGIIAAPPEVPAHAHLELPAEIEAMAQRLAELRASVSAQTTRLEAELDDGMRREVERVLADATATVREVRAAGERHAAVLARSKTLWTLIAHGAASGELPAAARALCAALPREFARRENAEPAAVIGTAEGSAFASREAEALVATPALTDYVKSSEQLRGNLAETERRIAEIDAASSSLESQIDAVASRYRSRLSGIANFAIVPLVGLFLAIWALRIVERLKLLVASGEARYVALGEEAPGALRKATMFAGIAAAVTVVGTVVAMLRFRAGDSPWLVLLLAGASAACIAAVALFAFGFVKSGELKQVTRQG